MRIIHSQVAGLDVHKKSVVAAVIVQQADGRWHQAKRTFGTMTVDLLALSDWLMSQGVTHVAMESTGEYRFVLTELLCQIDSLEETIARFDQEIEDYCRPFEEALALLDSIPGVARATAEAIVAEIGTDMRRFPTADHRFSWAGVAPGNHQSAGKRRSGRTTQGNQALGAALNQAAHAAAHTKNTYLAARRGKKKAIVAVMHSILVISYHLIQRNEPYRELGGSYFDQQRPEVTIQRLVKRLEKLGLQVSLQPAPVA